MNEFVNIDGSKLLLVRRENGHVMAYCDDLFKLVGLDGLSLKESTDRFYSLISLDGNYAMMFTSYECDLRQETARELIKRYLILDCGIRLANTTDDDLRGNDFEICRYYLEMLFDTWYTQADIFEMLKDEGFNIDINI